MAAILLQVLAGQSPSHRELSGETMQRKHANFAALALTGILSGPMLHAQEETTTTTTTVTNSVTDENGVTTLQAAAGQILLEGTIHSITAADPKVPGRTLSLKSTAFQLAGKPMRAITPPKFKPVNFDGEVLPAGAPPLRAGMKVQVLGLDGGTGTELAAHAILILDAKIPANAQPQNEAKGFPTEGVTLSEIVMPAELAPRPADRYAASYQPQATASPLLYPGGFSADGATLYLGCKWNLPLKDNPNRGDTFAHLYYSWSKDGGMKQEKKLPNTNQSESPLEKSRKESLEAQFLAKHPGYEVDEYGSLSAYSMTPDGGLMGGSYELAPTNLPPRPTGEYDAKTLAWHQARNKVMLKGGFIWRADTGFVNFDTYVKSLPAAQGKEWGAPLFPGSMSPDGKTIACLAENTGPGNRELRGSRVLLIHSPTGFAKK